MGFEVGFENNNFLGNGIRIPLHDPLKGTEYMMLQDFPQEIIEKRRKMMPKLKEARGKGLRVSFSRSEPDKLTINGKIVS